MNSWTVIWQKSAELALASIWNNSRDKMQVTQAAFRLEQALKKNPLSLGESRGRLRRTTFDKPLCINFEIIPDDAKVIVLTVREY